MAGVAEEGAGRRGDTTAGRRKDGGERSVGAQAVGAHEDRWRRRCGARSTRPDVEPADRRADAGACDGAAEATGVARFRADVRRRAVGQTTRHRREQGDGTRMDDGGRVVEGAAAATRRDAFLASATERVRRVGAVGHIESRLAGRQRRDGSVLSANDRRCHQSERGKFRTARWDTREHGRAVAVRGTSRSDGGCIHGPGPRCSW